MKNNQLIHWISSIILASHSVFGTEFTVEIPDNEEQCFFEYVKENVECRFDFQVVKGGELDIDVVVEGPNEEVVYKELRKEYDTVHFNSTVAGEYSICFSNEFSTITHKTLYISLEVGDENPVYKVIQEHDSAMTFMEATSDEIHKSLDDTINGQTHYRLQEAHGRRFAEDVNERVLWWSMMQTFVILAAGVSQVLILRNFFSDPRMDKPVVPQRQPRFGYGRL